MKSFIICLSKIESSLITALNLKKQLEDFSMPVELFEGTYGNDAVRMMIEENRILHPTTIKGTPTVQSSNLYKLELPGVKGCFYSHYRLWQKCVELNEPIIVFEDDILLQRSYIPVDWKDVLILALGHPRKSQRYMHYLTNSTGIPKAEAYDQVSMPGTCGYAIKPAAANKLINFYKSTYLSSDNCMNKNVIDIKIHGYLMGIALTKQTGKKSLVKTKMWEKYV
jgi:glycosyl transferase family 25